MYSERAHLMCSKRMLNVQSVYTLNVHTQYTHNDLIKQTQCGKPSLEN